MEVGAHGRGSSFAWLCDDCSILCTHDRREPPEGQCHKFYRGKYLGQLPSQVFRTRRLISATLSPSPHAQAQQRSQCFDEAFGAFVNPSTRRNIARRSTLSSGRRRYSSQSVYISYIG